MLYTTTYTIDDLLRKALEAKASDLHITVGIPPVLRIRGDLVPMENMERLRPEMTEALIHQLVKDDKWSELEQAGELDFSYSLGQVGRFRCTAFRQRGSYGLAIRLISPQVLPLEELGLPPVVRDLCDRRDGLILVTGPTGSGKSTTLAAMIDVINHQRHGVIITLEDPIEYIHRHAKCIVNQREVGSDTTSYASALKAALRADPDVILVGEMRDLETISTALIAAETGHLVLSTLHTRGGAQTIDRIIDVFPPHQQQQVRVQLAGVLQAVISQQLLRTVDGKRMVPAVEVLIGTTAIRNLIREGKTHQIPAAIETGARFGMQTMESSLEQLVNQGLVDPEELRWRRRL
ncbi:MAG TPA: type IV pilus twitching motility protein PilT [Firmicutes bacterium]|nr:type IV pilus twitching motility protein PilT [Bacillota bacterium]